MPENIKKNAVVVNSFARRQTKESPYSYYGGPGGIESVAYLAMDGLTNPEAVRQGYRDGVVLVSVDPAYFYSSIVKIDENTKFVDVFEARQEGEEKHALRRAIGPKLPAKRVDIVLYRRDVLEPRERSGPINIACTVKDFDGVKGVSLEGPLYAEWEVISINCSPTEQEVPMPPLTMARNFLQKAGGTAGDFSAKDFAESVWFWSQHAMCAGEPEKKSDGRSALERLWVKDAPPLPAMPQWTNLELVEALIAEARFDGGQGIRPHSVVVEQYRDAIMDRMR